MKSKIKNIIFITLIAFPFVGFTNKLKLGLHGGVNFSTISASNAPKEFNSAKGFLPGLLIGLSNEVKLNDDILSARGRFEPTHYILLDYDGSHYQLITYKI